MGKWATYRKRGSGQPSTTGLEAPPAPILSFDDYFLYQTAQGLDDSGGFVALERSTDGGTTWIGPYTRSWLPIINWGTISGFSGNTYRAVEVGNGTRYIGTSPISNLTTLP
jgi:hypothetical protein